MRSLYRKVREFRLVGAACALGFAFVAGGWLWAVAALRGATQPVVLHWSSIEGINQIGGLAELAVVALLALIATGVNCTIALALEEKDWFWGKLVAAFTLFMDILIFIGFAAIIAVNQ